MPETEPVAVKVSYFTPKLLSRSPVASVMVALANRLLSTSLISRVGATLTAVPRGLKVTVLSLPAAVNTISDGVVPSVVKLDAFRLLRAPTASAVNVTEPSALATAVQSDAPPLPFTCAANALAICTAVAPAAMANEGKSSNSKVVAVAVGKN